MDQQFKVFVGVDLAMTAPHQAWVVDKQLEKLGERAFAHTAEALCSFVDWLLTLAPVDELAVAVESPHGAVVDTLLERGVAVFHINPKQLDRFRDRESVAGAKCDRRDSRVLAGTLCTDRHCYRRVDPAAAKYVRLREASREREGLVAQEAALANQLRDVLHRFYPQALTRCPAADEPWLWDLLKLAPTPEDAVRLSHKQLRNLLKKRRIRRVTASHLAADLSGPTVSVIPGVTESCRGRVLRLVRALFTAHENRRELEGELRSALAAVSGEDGGESSDEAERAEQRDAQIIRSMPGVGVLVSATLLGEAPRELQRRDYDVLRCLAGAAPVAESSGKRRRKRAKIKMRRACNLRLRNAVHHMASVAAQHDPAAKAHYQALRARGASYGRALRGVADRLLRILCAALRSASEYDPGRLQGPYAAPAVVA